jgi:hypothetical protein
MRQTRLPIPLLGVLAVTRMMLGAGVAMLVVERIRIKHRRRVGLALTAVGVASTIPLLLTVRSRRDGVHSP